MTSRAKTALWGSSILHVVLLYVVLSWEPNLAPSFPKTNSVTIRLESIAVEKLSGGQNEQEERSSPQEKQTPSFLEKPKETLPRDTPQKKSPIPLIPATDPPLSKTILVAEPETKLPAVAGIPSLDSLSFMQAKAMVSIPLMGEREMEPPRANDLLVPTNVSPEVEIVWAREGNRRVIHRPAFVFEPSALSGVLFSEINLILEIGPDGNVVAVKIADPGSGFVLFDKLLGLKAREYSFQPSDAGENEQISIRVKLRRSRF